MPGIIDQIGAKLRRIMNMNAAETFDQATDSLEAISDAVGAIPPSPSALLGICSVGMVASTTTIVCGNLADIFEDDTFNSRFVMIVIKNNNSLLGAPEMERRDITDFVGLTATFTTEAFSANVEASDEVLILPVELATRISAVGILTTSSATVPADVTRRAADASDYWNGCLLMPLSGVCAFQPRRINDFTTATGVFTLDTTTPFTAAPGTVPYAILPDQGSTGMDILATGTFTTSSATVPADTGRTEANDYWKGCVLMPIAGVAAFQPRPIRQYTATTDVFTLDEPFTIAPGLVAYVILRAEYPVQRLLDIFGETNAILQLSETGGTITTDGAVQNVYINNAPAGVYKPEAIQLDLTAMAALDQIQVRVYYRISTAGNLIMQDDITFSDLQAIPLKTITLLPNRFGIQVTLQELAGAHNDIPWAVYYSD